MSTVTKETSMTTVIQVMNHLGFTIQGNITHVIKNMLPDGLKNMAEKTKDEIKNKCEKYNEKYHKEIEKIPNPLGNIDLPI